MPIPGTVPSTPQPTDIFDQLEQAYLLTDREGNTLAVNDYFLRLCGYQREDVLGKSYHHIFGLPADRAVRQQLYDKAIQEEILHTPYEWPLLTHDGRLCVMQWTGGFTRDEEGRVNGLWRVGARQQPSSGFSGQRPGFGLAAQC
jgi:PAS domain S-box-containing protein